MKMKRNEAERDKKRKLLSILLMFNSSYLSSALNLATPAAATPPKAPAHTHCNSGKAA